MSQHFPARNFDRHDRFYSALPSVRQETFFLNPVLSSDAYYEDFNDTSDYPNINYENYEFSNSSNISYTASYEEEDSQSTDDGRTYGYNANSTVIANFFTDSTVAENFYINSTTQDETTTSTIETNTMEGTDIFLTSYAQIINNQIIIELSALYYLIFIT